MQWLLLSLAISMGYMPQNVQIIDYSMFEQPCFTQTVEVSGLVA